MRITPILLLWLLLAMGLRAQSYDLLLKGGQVIDPANGIDGVRDVAIAGGRIAAVAADIPESSARTVKRVDGHYVTPGLVDMHTHVYLKGRSATVVADQSVLPHGTTTIVDAGVSGWKTFADFKETVIDVSKTRVQRCHADLGGRRLTTAAPQLVGIAAFLSTSKSAVLDRKTVPSCRARTPPTHLGDNIVPDPFQRLTPVELFAALNAGCVSQSPRA